MMEIQQLLQLTVDRGASDLHLVAGIPPAIRLDGILVRIPGEAPLAREGVCRAYPKKKRQIL